jgi:hypothetical protein
MNPSRAELYHFRQQFGGSGQDEAAAAEDEGGGRPLCEGSPCDMTLRFYSRGGVGVRVRAHRRILVSASYVLRTHVEFNVAKKRQKVAEEAAAEQEKREEGETREQEKREEREEEQREEEKREGELLSWQLDEPQELEAARMLLVWVYEGWEEGGPFLSYARSARMPDLLRVCKVAAELGVDDFVASCGPRYAKLIGDRREEFRAKLYLAELTPEELARGGEPPPEGRPSSPRSHFDRFDRYYVFRKFPALAPALADHPCVREVHAAVGGVLAQHVFRAAPEMLLARFVVDEAGTTILPVTQGYAARLHEGALRDWRSLTALEVLGVAAAAVQGPRGLAANDVLVLAADWLAAARSLEDDGEGDGRADYDGMRADEFGARLARVLALSHLSPLYLSHLRIVLPWLKAPADEAVLAGALLERMQSKVRYWRCREVARWHDITLDAGVMRQMCRRATSPSASAAAATSASSTSCFSCSTYFHGYDLVFGITVAPAACSTVHFPSGRGGAEADGGAARQQEAGAARQQEAGAARQQEAGAARQQDAGAARQQDAGREQQEGRKRYVDVNVFLMLDLPRAVLALSALDKERAALPKVDVDATITLLALNARGRTTTLLFGDKCQLGVHKVVPAMRMVDAEALEDVRNVTKLTLSLHRVDMTEVQG